MKPSQNQHKLMPWAEKVLDTTDELAQARRRLIRIAQQLNRRGMPSSEADAGAFLRWLGRQPLSTKDLLLSRRDAKKKVIRLMKGLWFRTGHGEPIAGGDGERDVLEDAARAVEGYRQFVSEHGHSPFAAVVEMSFSQNIEYLKTDYSGWALGWIWKRLYSRPHVHVSCGWATSVPPEQREAVYTATKKWHEKHKHELVWDERTERFKKNGEEAFELPAAMLQ